MVKGIGTWIKEARTFSQQVIQEGKKVIWPTRGDVVVTSIIVFVLSMMCAICLFCMDQLILFGLRWIMEI